jgi:16S rRNA (guanine527-N7)-methyltransferase
MTATEFRTRLTRRLRRAGIALSEDQVAALVSYHQLLARWNEKINLTSLATPEDAIDRLLLEPLLAARHVPAADAAVIDIGSGGGSPGIPLKIALPSLRLWLVESKARKAAFLREAVRQLDLSNVRVEATRYEELLPRPELHEALDVVTLRAVRVETKTLLSLQAFLRPGGLILLFRGPQGSTAPAVTPLLEWVATHPLVDSLQSRLVILRKASVGR